jgi:beta-fructofuranosidase
MPAIRILVDGSIVELFTSAGKVLTTRVYPTTPSPWRIKSPTDTLVWELGP